MRSYHLTFATLVAILLPFLALATSCDCNKQGNETEKAGIILQLVACARAPHRQQDMVAFAAEPMESVRIGVIGLGMRGPGAVEALLLLSLVPK